MKNVQIIDGACNATFSVFQASDAEFDLIFPDGCDMALVEDVIARLGERAADQAFSAIWDRPVLKRDANGIHGTLFYDWMDRREHLPTSMKEVDWDHGSINAAQRRLFAQSR